MHDITKQVIGLRSNNFTDDIEIFEEPCISLLKAN